VALACGAEAPGGRPGEAVATPAEIAIAGPLSCERPRHDFGTVREGEVLEHEFRLRAREELVVHDLAADCGCTVARLERLEVIGAGGTVPFEEGETLAAGDELALFVRIDTNGRPGSAEREIKLYHDRDPGFLSVRVSADVVPLVRFVPDPIPLLEQTAGEPASLEIAVLATDGEPFHLSHDPFGWPPTGRVELFPVDGPDLDAPDRNGHGGDSPTRAREWRVRVGFTADHPRGAAGYPLRLRTDIGAAPGEEGGKDGGEDTGHRVARQVSLRTIGKVSVAPPAITFGGVRSDEVLSRTLRVVCHDPAHELSEPSVRIEAVPASREFALARTAGVVARPVDGENAWDVELVLDGLDAEVPGTFAARLVVATGHPEEPELTVPITGFRLGGGAAARNAESPLAGAGGL